MAAIDEKGVQKVIKLLLGRKVLLGRQVLSYKLAPDGTIVRYKARWVAKGFKQVEGIDFHSTWSSVVKSASWRILLALATRYGMEIEHSDVDIAYLEALLDEEVWVE